MLESIVAFLKFWWRCAVVGWNLGNNFVAFLQGLLLLVIAIIWLVTKRKESITWEEPAMKWIGCILLVSFIINTVFVAPFLEFNRIERQLVNEAGKTTNKKRTIDVPAATDLLKRYANGLANAEIVFWSNSHRDLVELINSTFTRAGWKVNYVKTAQEPFHSDIFRGIEVRGFDSHLVDEGAKAVTMLGGWDVRKQVDRLEEDNPDAEHRLYLTVGYPSDDGQ